MANESSLAADPALRLPKHLPEAFEKLIRGRHLCSQDAVYFDVHQNFATYQAVFAGLGYRLVEDAHGFVYVDREGSASEAVNQAVVFIWVLVDWMADNGLIINDVITTMTFEFEKLPHLATDRYRGYMSQVNISSRDDLWDLLRFMDTRFGFLRSVSSYDSFKLLPPVFRVLNVAMEIAMPKEEPVPPAVEAP
ncbi:MAG: hypothetical protein E6Q76_08170 [Rhizobium sp.]|nr:MAG: hypothetical protein E6Q76_08170 [Rhizobium sp.]